MKQNVRVVQDDPLHPIAHEQTPGLEHVPPFEQTGEHTAKEIVTHSFSATSRHSTQSVIASGSIDTHRVVFSRKKITYV